MLTGSFHRNDWPSLGVELELQLVDAQTLALRSAYSEVARRIPPSLADGIQPEFMQCYVEVSTGICRTVDDVGRDLGRKLQAVEAAAEQCGTRLFWGATHPFSRWQDQQITPNERYYKLADRLQETVTRPVTFGLHVHVGVESGDTAMGVVNRLARHLPVLLAFSANSPFWHGRFTGHHSHRIEVLEGFPTGGLPPQLPSWSDYLDLVNQMAAAGFIESPADLWWDIRPNAQLGTVEVRICDMPPDLPRVLALTALVQCLVATLAHEVDAGLDAPECLALLIRQNRWRACRYGLRAELVDPIDDRPVPARELLERKVLRVSRAAEALGCTRHLETLLELAAQPTGAEQQLAAYRETGDLTEVVRALSRQSPLMPARRPSAVVSDRHADRLGSCHTAAAGSLPGLMPTLAPTPPHGM